MANSQKMDCAGHTPATRRSSCIRVTPTEHPVLAHIEKPASNHKDGEIGAVRRYVIFGLAVPYRIGIRVRIMSLYSNICAMSDELCPITASIDGRPLFVFT